MSEELNGTQAVPEENIEELKNKIATITQEKDNVVGELKDDRQKRSKMQEEIDELKELLKSATQANAQVPVAGDVASLVEQAIEKKLVERDASVAKSNRVAAIDRFVNNNKAFHPDNDTTGARREALENKLRMFNTDGLKSVDEFYKVVVDAAKLLGTDTVPTNHEYVEEVPGTSTAPAHHAPRVARDGEVSVEEKKLYESNGWTKEKYLALKANNPEFIRTLLKAAGY